MITGRATITALVVLLSSCGGSSSSTSSSSVPASSSSTSQTGQSPGQFKAAIAPVLNEFKGASQATGAALQKAGSQSDAQLAAAFQQLAARWNSALTQLKALKPPPRFTAAYNRLKSQVSKVTGDLAGIVSAAQSHNAAAAKAGANALVNDIVSAKATSTTLSNGTP